MQDMVCIELTFVCVNIIYYRFICLLQQAGAKVICLHGCVGPCGKKVWGPGDRTDRCEFCGTSRYNEQGKPQECIYHFPIHDRLQSLLKCQQVTEALQWEHVRKKNPDYISG